MEKLRPKAQGRFSCGMNVKVLYRYVLYLTVSECLLDASIKYLLF